MNKEPHQVSIVLDRSYGPLLRELIDAGPVWVVDSPVNTDFTRQLWAESPTRSHLDGVTTFKASENRSPEQMLIDWMDTIDLSDEHQSGNVGTNSSEVVWVSLKE